MGSLKEAEAVKIVENSFRDINVAFVNELAKSFTHLGIDIMRVIGGASTKPFAFMPHYPGCGVGGHCIPVDPYYLIEYAKQNGFQHKFLSLARRINNSMPEFTVDLVTRALEKKSIPPRDAKVAVLGLAYKPDIDDCRESPALKIARILRDREIDVDTYDPYVPEHSTVESLTGALRDANAALIATGHTAFTELGPKDFIKHNVRVVVDGRNCLPKERFVEAGIDYYGIGR
jgi:nucleotide sugar dehydrogenase